MLYLANRILILSRFFIEKRFQSSKSAGKLYKSIIATSTDKQFNNILMIDLAIHYLLF